MFEGKNISPTRMQGLISFMSAMGLTLLEGDRAATDCEGRVWLQPLPENPTPEDILMYFGRGVHEQSHYYGKSDPKALGAIKRIIFSFINGVDDVRCEYTQEVGEYPGLITYRKPYYDLKLEQFGREMFKTASKANMPEFLHALNCLIIMRARLTQLKHDAEYELSDDLDSAYTKYIADLEPEILAQKDWLDSVALGKKIWERVMEMVTDDEELKDPPEPSDGEGGESGEPEDSESDGEGSSEESGDDSEGDGESGGESGEESDDGESGEGSSGEASDDDSDGEGSSGGESDDSDADGEGSSGEASDGDAEAGGDAEGDAEAKRAERVKKAIKKALDDIEKNADKVKTVDDDSAERIEVIAGDDSRYMVMSGVEDVIRYNDNNDGGDPHANVAEGLKMLGGVSSQLTQLFISNTKPRIKRHKYRGKLDLRTVVSDHTDMRKDLYSRYKKGSLDKAAVSLMIDNSGSMARRGRDVKSYRIAGAMLDLFSRARIPCECAGFTCEGADSDHYRDLPCYTDIVKTFDDPWDLKAMNRCFPPSYMCENSEVDTMKWMIPRLLSRPEGKKVFIIFGDGEPCIGSTSLNAKLKRAYIEYINACRKVGVIVFGFGLDCNLSHIFGDDYLNVSSSTMGPDILEKIRDIINKPTR